jgi:hypothetical protein
MFSGIPLLTFAFSTINIAYMFFAQEIVYNVRSKPNIKIMLGAYFAWTIMSFALRELVIKRSDFGIQSIVTHGPLLGLLIYSCVGIGLFTLKKHWSFNTYLTDVVFGVLMFMTVTAFAVMFREYI